MHRNTVWPYVVVIVALYFSCLPPNQAKARILLVDESGSGEYLLISEAVAAASSGDTVAIRPGTYDEYDGTSYHIQRDSISISVIGLGEPQDVRLRLSMLFIDCAVVVMGDNYYSRSYCLIDRCYRTVAVAASSDFLCLAVHSPCPAVAGRSSSRASALRHSRILRCSVRS